jgi:hypothetical protein
MKELIRQILNEIKFSQDNAEELKKKFGWRFVQSSGPKEGKEYKKLHIYTFKTPKKFKETSGYKYIVHIEEYEYDYYLISFFPKLNKDFYVKQSKLSSAGLKYDDEYSFQTRENIPFKILTLMVSEMKNILNNKPFASFGYFGAPDVKTGSEGDLFNTKRVRIYNKIIQDELSETHKVFSDPTFSGSVIINKEVLEQHPSYKDYCLDILISHL